MARALGYNVPMRTSLALLLLAGCDADLCDALKDRAEACGYPPGSDSQADVSACERAEAMLGKSNFKHYAKCMQDAGCDDNDAMEACLSEAAGEDPCERFAAWAAGCGLEPTGTANGCEDLEAGVAGVGFADWVSCVTADG